MSPGAEVDKVELDISAQYTRIYPYSCCSCVFLMYSVHAPTIIMCLNNSLRSGYNVIRVEILCLSLSDSRNRLCATTTVWGSPCDAAGEQDANVGYQICDRSWTFATKRPSREEQPCRPASRRIKTAPLCCHNTRGCQDKYPISWATVIANKTTIFDVILPEQLGILT